MQFPPVFFLAAHSSDAAPLSRVLDSVAQLPWIAHVAVIIGMLAGMVLWATGRHVLRQTIGFCSGASGALLGLVSIPLLAPGAGVSPLVGALGGGVLGLLLGFLLYRVAVGTTFGLALGGATALLALAILTSPLGERVAQNSSTVSDTGAAFQPTEPPRVLGALSIEPRVPLSLALTTTESEAAAFRQTSSDFVRSLRYAFEFAWEDLKPSHRWYVIGAGALASIIGVMLGLALPTWAAGLVTALVGSAIWLPAAVWLARAANAPGAESLALVPPTGWAITWLATASVGLGLQWMGLIRGTPKHQPPAAG
ncbi:MAG: hypothetical protein AB7K52_13335 [Phycisphaerales bacterium]